MASKIDLQRKLSTFDVTNLVVGSIIGADIYVATAIGAKLIGPSSLVVWVLAGLMAMVIALSFAYCVMIHPKVGGPYAYVREAAGPFPGFLIGWALLLAEWFSLAVFPVAFAQYFIALSPGIGPLGVVALKALFIAIIIITNIAGVRSAGRLNDVLTVAKLSPLLLIVLAGLTFMLLRPAAVSANLTPFITGGPAAFGQAVVLIFWAYAGFELSTLPADEVQEPERTIPRAIVLGMLIVIGFYLLTNFVVVGVVSEPVLSSSASPLIDAALVMFPSPPVITNIVILVVGVGALLSIMGADESGTIGTSRLAYAMSVDGLLPAAFSREHKRFGTPYIGLIILGATAFGASLLGGLSTLINASVFLLALVYLATCLATIRLERTHADVAGRLRLRTSVPVAGAAMALVLLVLVEPLEVLVSVILLALGVPLYIWFSPKREIRELRSRFLSREAILRRAYHQSLRFLAYPLTLLKRRLRGNRRTFTVEEPSAKGRKG